jgi:hypothetical protein
MDRGRYRAPLAPGFSSEMKAASVARYTFRPTTTGQNA